MPAQSPFPDAAGRAFGLIETFKWTREHGYALLPEHMTRLEHSAGQFGFALAPSTVARRLEDFAGGLEGPTSRVRLVLFVDGSLDLSASGLSDTPPPAFRVAVAEQRHQPDDPWLRHKTTMRDRYEQPLAAAVASANVDEVVFLNDRAELCEGARTNIFVARDDILLTPVLSCGLLPGTLRAHLLQSGQAREAVLRLADLDAATWYVGNSVRGLIPAVLAA